MAVPGHKGGPQKWPARSARDTGRRKSDQGPRGTQRMKREYHLKSHLQHGVSLWWPDCGETLGERVRVGGGGGRLMLLWVVCGALEKREPACTGAPDRPRCTGGKHKEARNGNTDRVVFAIFPFKFLFSLPVHLDTGALIRLGCLGLLRRASKLIPLPPHYLFMRPPPTCGCHNAPALSVQGPGV